MISKLHYITQDIPGKSHQQLAIEACEAGIDWLQLRVKNTGFEEWLEIAKEVVTICKNHNVTIVINDNPEIARLSGADGVHLGKKDIDPLTAREILGKNSIIGGTANTLEDIEKLIEMGVNYIGLGPYRFTSTKENLSPILGLDGIKNYALGSKINIPVVVIGGITPSDVEDIRATGAHGIAVSSAINYADNKTLVVKEFMNKLKSNI